MDDELKYSLKIVIWPLVAGLGLIGLILMVTLVASIPLIVGAVPFQNLVDVSTLWSTDYIFAYCITFPCSVLVCLNFISNRKPSDAEPSAGKLSESAR